MSSVQTHFTYQSASLSRRNSPRQLEHELHISICLNTLGLVGFSMSFSSAHLEGSCINQQTMCPRILCFVADFMSFSFVQVYCFNILQNHFDYLLFLFHNRVLLSFSFLPCSISSMQILFSCKSV